MKSCEQMAMDVLTRRDIYQKKQKAYRRAAVATILPFCCVCVAVFVGFRWLGRDIQQEQTPLVQDSTQPSGTLLEQRIENLEELSKSGDCIGWLVYENALYMQIQNADISNVKTETCVGCAFDFRGFYQTQKEIDGDVYTVLGASNQLLLQLENGGTVLLQKEIN